MHGKTRLAGAGVAVAIAAGLGYALLLNHDDELDFETLTRDGAFSIRAYPELLVAETIEHGPRESALARGFSTLADFLGGLTRGTRVPVTAPIFADGDDDGRGWRTRLALPARLRGEALPEAAAGVTIRTLAPRRLAALRFPGDTSDSALAQREADLRYWMEINGYRPAGPVGHAFYNSPFVPAVLKRSDVLIPLAA